MQDILFAIGGRAVSLGEVVAVGAGLAFIFLLLITIILISSQRRRVAEAADMENRLRELAYLQSEMTGRMQSVAEQTSSGQSELKRALNDRLDQVSHRMGQNLAESSRATGENLTHLAERLAVIDNAQRNLTELSNRVVGLQQILSNKQTRGAFGQGRMEAIVADGLPKNSYSFQHTLSNGKRPDCVVKLPDTDQVIVIDAKFPLEGFSALKAAKNDAEARDASARVRIDVGKHVSDIAKRYRVLGETQDTLIMFVPSESLYADLYENFDDIIQKAYKVRVIIVSPNMLMLAVQTMQAVMKDAHMRQQAGVIIQLEVAKMMDDVSRLRDRVSKLSRHFDLAGRAIEDINTSAQKVTSRGEKITALEIEDESAVAASADARPALVVGE
ncbi:MAG: DNA recombination protein RmuC [Alphaproteobacteria bacterium]|nr:DNA recombination protein RmuC [Alphaproteobacteria bacterium]